MVVVVGSPLLLTSLPLANRIDHHQLTDHQRSLVLAAAADTGLDSRSPPPGDQLSPTTLSNNALNVDNLQAVTIGQHLNAHSQAAGGTIELRQRANFEHLQPSVQGGGQLVVDSGDNQETSRLRSVVTIGGQQQQQHVELGGYFGSVGGQQLIGQQQQVRSAPLTSGPSTAAITTVTSHVAAIGSNASNSGSNLDCMPLVCPCPVLD